MSVNSVSFHVITPFIFYNKRGLFFMDQAQKNPSNDDEN
jgi:hypothetical protein